MLGRGRGLGRGGGCVGLRLRGRGGAASYAHGESGCDGLISRAVGRGGGGVCGGCALLALLLIFIKARDEGGAHLVAHSGSAAAFGENTERPAVGVRHAGKERYTHDVFLLRVCFVEEHGLSLKLFAAGVFQAIGVFDEPFGIIVLGGFPRGAFVALAIGQHVSVCYAFAFGHRFVVDDSYHDGVVRHGVKVDDDIPITLVPGAAYGAICKHGVCVVFAEGIVSGKPLHGHVDVTEL